MNSFSIGSIHSNDPNGLYEQEYNKLQSDSSVNTQNKTSLIRRGRPSRKIQNTPKFDPSDQIQPKTQIQLKAKIQPNKKTKTLVDWKKGKTVIAKRRGIKKLIENNVEIDEEQRNQLQDEEVKFFCHCNSGEDYINRIEHFFSQKIKEFISQKAQLLQKAPENQIQVQHPSHSHETAIFFKKRFLSTFLSSQSLSQPDQNGAIPLSITSSQTKLNKSAISIISPSTTSSETSSNSQMNLENSPPFISTPSTTLSQSNQKVSLTSPLPKGFEQKKIVKPKIRLMRHKWIAFVEENLCALLALNGEVALPMIDNLRKEAAEIDNSAYKKDPKLENYIVLQQNNMIAFKKSIQSLPEYKISKTSLQTNKEVLLTSTSKKTDPRILLTRQEWILFVEENLCKLAKKIPLSMIQELRTLAKGADQYDFEISSTLNEYQLLKQKNERVFTTIISNILSPKIIIPTIPTNDDIPIEHNFSTVIDPRIVITKKKWECLFEENMISLLKQGISLSMIKELRTIAAYFKNDAYVKSSCLSEYKSILDQYTAITYVIFHNILSLHKNVNQSSNSK